MKLFKILLILVVIAGLAAGLWYIQPWNKYSPARIASLDDPSNLVWNMQNMREILPSRTVASQASTAWDENHQPLELEFEFNGAQKSLDQFLAESTTSGLLVIKNGVLVHEQYLQGASVETLFTSWSVAKSFVATAIAMAVEEGKITSFEDPVEKYAPQFKGSDYGASKISDLLMMSSGIDFIEIYGDGPSDVRPFFFNSFILGKNPDEYLKPFVLNRPPLTDFDYISSNSHVLSAVLRGVYQQPLTKIIESKLWQVLGMEADANWQVHRDDERGQALGYCCLNARLRDYARFGQFHLNAQKGRGIGVELLPADWVAKLPLPATKAHMPGGERYVGRGYSQHFWLPINAPGVFFAAGVYGQYIWIDPANEIVIVRTSADPEWTSRYPESEAVFKAITAHFQ